jgi:ankyrin repeat domain-containing protein 50
VAITHLIDYFQDLGVCVAFAFCRYTEPVSVTEILAALVRQLLEQCPSLLQFVRPLYERHTLHGTKLTQRELLDLLRQFSRVVRIVFIIDGLDEASYDTQFDLVDAIASLNARFLITSRPLERLKSAVPDAVFFEVRARVEDIELLVSQKIQRDPRFAGFLEKHKLKNEVVTRVTKNSGGM